MTKKFIATIAFLLISSLTLSTPAYTGNGPDKTGVLIKVDSAGLKATIVATSEDDAASGQSAIAVAYKRLLLTINEIPVDFFPKRRYVYKDGYINGAQVIETRYYGDGSVEADVGLDIALESAFADRFEKSMRLSGYKVIECDSSPRGIGQEEWKSFIKE